MEKSICGSMKQCSKPKWDWMQVDCHLKTEVNRKYTMWSLAPSIVLTSPTGEGPDPNVKLYVDTEKSLQFSEELGWNWHKSWNLPNISIRVEIKDVATGELLLAPKNLYAQLFAVKVVVDSHDKSQNAHLVDVGIRGTSKIQMVDGQAYFTAIKFMSTSYNNEGVKFYLLLMLYINNNDNEPPKILTATLSPPIFVDSRKSARDNQQKKYSSFIEPFLVDNLDKDFIKRENRRKNENQIKIRNDFQGLFSYLTAPNIRHKVKHPVFLAIKFSACAKLYFNTNLLSKDTGINEMLNILQKKISKDHSSKKTARNTVKIDDKMFILTIVESSDSYKSKKVQESIDSLDCSSLGIIYNPEELPPFFQNITAVGNLTNAYREEYSQLYLIAKSIINIEHDDSKDNSDESESGSDADCDDDDDESPIEAKPAEKFNRLRRGGRDSDDADKSIPEKVKKEHNTPTQTAFAQVAPSQPVQEQQTAALKKPTSFTNIQRIPTTAGADNSYGDQTNVQQSEPAIEPRAPQPPPTQFPQVPGNNAYMEQLLLSNFMLSNALNNLKMQGLMQPPNLMQGFAGLQNKPMTQTPDLLSMLSSQMNPLSNMQSLASLVGGGLQSNQQKMGFTSIVPPATTASQQPPNPLGGNMTNSVQALQQQLSYYKDILDRLAFTGQMNMPMLGNLSGLQSNLSNIAQSQHLHNMQQQLSQLQQQQQQMSQSVPNMPSTGINPFGYFPQQMPNSQPVDDKNTYDLYKLLQMRTEKTEKEAKQEEH